MPSSKSAKESLKNTGIVGGSQFIGMGKDLAEAFPEARETFQEVDDALSQSLSSMMFDGDENELNLTENTQPALMAVSMAAVNILKKQGNIVLNVKTLYSTINSKSPMRYQYN